MLVDATNTSSQLVGQTQSNDATTRNKDANHENELSRPGQSSDAGPAVVTSFSAAALESSRAVSETGQAVDNSKANQDERAPQNELVSDKIQDILQPVVDVFV